MHPVRHLHDHEAEAQRRLTSSLDHLGEAAAADVLGDGTSALLHTEAAGHQAHSAWETLVDLAKERNRLLRQRHDLVFGGVTRG